MRLLLSKVINFACSYQPLQLNFIKAYLNVLGELAKLYLPSKKNTVASHSLDSYYLFFTLITSLLENHFDICRELKKDQWLVQSQVVTLGCLASYQPSKKKAKSLTSRSICKTFERSLRQAKDEHWKLYMTVFENDKSNNLSSVFVGLLASASIQHDNVSKVSYKTGYIFFFF